MAEATRVSIEGIVGVANTFVEWTPASPTSLSPSSLATSPPYLPPPSEAHPHIRIVTRSGAATTYEARIHEEAAISHPTSGYPGLLVSGP